MSKKRKWKPYRTYSFSGKDPVIDKIRVAMDTSGNSATSVAADSGVSHSTLYNWFRKDGTKRPQFATINAVAMAMGYEMVMQPRTSASASRSRGTRPSAAAMARTAINARRGQAQGQQIQAH